MSYLSLYVPDSPNGVPFGPRHRGHRAPATGGHRYNSTYHPPTNGCTTGATPPDDLSLYRTPSGAYYCPSCNVTLSSDGLFVQHMESRKHKILTSPQQEQQQITILADCNTCTTTTSCDDGMVTR
ncbi:hypothetical protein LSH36_105g03000 [Paralvinella palmiformis]|uniref:C2H2-type domain-containing protein n=1 Tax=Paralvinella palmiformis TaxID=53620 RepID=A0AAD9JZD2_9ANNE|nr:hypothetical protein LSH36_105g03000 [Paralvinella palmiformis]